LHSLSCQSVSKFLCNRPIPARVWPPAGLAVRGQPGKITQTRSAAGHGARPGASCPSSISLFLGPAQNGSQRMNRCFFPLLAWCGFAVLLLAPCAARGALGDDPAADEDLLEEAGFAFDGPALLDFFQKRSLPESDRSALLQKLVGQLADKRSKMRKKAMA